MRLKLAAHPAQGVRWGVLPPRFFQTADKSMKRATLVLVPGRSRCTRALIWIKHLLRARRSLHQSQRAEPTRSVRTGRRL